MSEKEKQQILVVDDDSEIRDAYRARLESSGYTVVEAVDGEDGITKAMNHIPDLIILDLMMPKINGLDVLDILKSTNATRQIPVVVVTALVHDDVRKRVIDSGAAAYLTKFEYRPSRVVEACKYILNNLDME